MLRGPLGNNKYKPKFSGHDTFPDLWEFGGGNAAERNERPARLLQDGAPD